MKITMSEAIKAVKSYAMKHYNNGGDIVIECMEDSEIADFLRDCKEDNLNVQKELDSMFRIHNSLMQEMDAGIAAMFAGIIE